jgi:hypothetical protein
VHVIGNHQSRTVPVRSGVTLVFGKSWHGRLARADGARTSKIVRTAETAVPQGNVKNTRHTSPVWTEGPDLTLVVSTRGWLKRLGPSGSARVDTTRL